MIIEQQIRTTTAVMILQLQLFHNQQSKQGLQPEYKYVPLFQNRQKILLIYQQPLLPLPFLTRPGSLPAGEKLTQVL